MPTDTGRSFFVLLAREFVLGDLRVDLEQVGTTPFGIGTRRQDARIARSRDVVQKVLNRRCGRLRLPVRLALYRHLVRDALLVVTVRHRYFVLLVTVFLVIYSLVVPLERDEIYLFALGCLM